MVLCADSQETVGVMKFDAPKLVILPSNGSPDDRVRMMFAGAGDGPFIDKLVEKMWEAALRGPGMTNAAVFERVEDANIEWHRRIWEAYGAGERPGAELLIVIYTHHEVTLYRSYGPIITQVDDYAFVGIGGELGTFLAEHLNADSSSIEEDVSDAVYILDNVKKYVESCGGDTQLAALMLDGRIHKMRPMDADSLAAGMEGIAREIYYLFMLARSLGSRKADIDRSAQSTVREIHRYRAEMRKKVRERIKVSPRLERSVQIRYEKIEWPPTREQPE